MPYIHVMHIHHMVTYNILSTVCKEINKSLTIQLKKMNMFGIDNKSL